MNLVSGIALLVLASGALYHSIKKMNGKVLLVAILLSTAGSVTTIHALYPKDDLVRCTILALTSATLLCGSGWIHKRLDLYLDGEKV